jgi:hypothetical protein
VYYSGQTTLALDALKAFKRKYAIDIVVNGVLDNVSRLQVNTEITTGRAIAGVWQLSSKAITLGALDWRHVEQAAPVCQLSALVLGASWAISVRRMANVGT